MSTGGPVDAGAEQLRYLWVYLSSGQSLSQEEQGVLDPLDDGSAACELPGPVPSLHQRAAEALTARLCAPQSAEAFRVGDRQDELHVTIQNTYRLPRMQGQAVRQSLAQRKPAPSERVVRPTRLRRSERIPRASLRNDPPRTTW